MQDLACGFRRQETGCAGEGIDEASYCAFRRQGDGAGRKSEPPAKRVVCSGPIRAYYRLRLKTLAFTLFKPSALAALTTP